MTAPFQPSFNLNTPIEQLRKRGLMIATPMYGGMATEQYVRSMLQFNWIAAENRLSVIPYFLTNVSLITRGRNICCHSFLQSNADHLLFIDADIGFEPEHVLALLDLQSAASEFDVICAPYPKKRIVWEQVARAARCGVPDTALAQFSCEHQFVPVQGGSSREAAFPVGEPLEVLRAATGFMMIKRSVLEALQEAHPDWRYREGPHHMVQYFQAAIEQHDPRANYEAALQKIAVGATDAQQTASDALRQAEEEPAKRVPAYLSEDYWFCARVCELGMKIWMCPWISLKHAGTHIFESALATQGEVVRFTTPEKPSLRGAA